MTKTYDVASAATPGTDVPTNPMMIRENSPLAISAVPARNCPRRATPSRRAANIPVSTLVAAVTGAMGSKFGMAMRGRKETLFLPYRTTNTVIEYEPDCRIAWKTTALGGLLGGRIWRYELSPTEEGTLVRERIAKLLDG
jgi:hypothetical protein